MQRLSTVAKAIPEAAEGINRYVTAIATYRLERRAGASHAEAQRAAVLAVEQTQGGYSRANNPAFCQNPLLRLPLQFKKYGLMYGQLLLRQPRHLAELQGGQGDPRGGGQDLVRRLSAMT